MKIEYDLKYDIYVEHCKICKEKLKIIKIVKYAGDVRIFYECIHCGRKYWHGYISYMELYEDK